MLILPKPWRELYSSSYDTAQKKHDIFLSGRIYKAGRPVVSAESAGGTKGGGEKALLLKSKNPASFQSAGFLLFDLCFFKISLLCMELHAALRSRRFSPRAFRRRYYAFFKRLLIRTAPLEREALICSRKKRGSCVLKKAARRILPLVRAETSASLHNPFAQRHHVGDGQLIVGAVQVSGGKFAVAVRAAYNQLPQPHNIQDGGLSIVVQIAR